MGKWFPPGIFVRNRIDWTTRLTRSGAGYVVAGSSYYPGVNLYNDATDSTYIAVLALLVYVPADPPIVHQTIRSGTAGTKQNAAVPLYPDGAYIPGDVYTYGTFGTDINEHGNYLVGNGHSWVHLDGAPLAVLKPGQRFNLEQNRDAAGGLISGGSMFASFIWSVYHL